MSRPDWCDEATWEKAAYMAMGYGLTDTAQSTLATSIARAFAAAEQRGAEREREACAKLIEDGYERKVGTPYHGPSIPSKNDKCPHGLYMYEDCEQCAANAIRGRKA